MMPEREHESAEDGLGLEAFGRPPEDAGLSLDQLSAAFAEMLGSGADPYASPAATESAECDEAEPAAGEAIEPAGPTAADRDDGCEITPKSILEAMLFVGAPDNSPLTSPQIASLMRGVRPAEIDGLVRELNQAYTARGCPYAIVSEGPGYRLALGERFRGIRDKFYGKARQARLSQAAIEVLAAVAYHEPLTAEEVNALRGTHSGAILTQLVRRQLLRLGRVTQKPRIVRYYTTGRFLELFGLESLADLPRSQDLEER